MLPYRTKRRTTINFKTKNNQNCQKIKLHGKSDNQEVTEIFIQADGRGRDGQQGRWGGEDHSNTEVLAKMEK